MELEFCHHCRKVYIVEEAHSPGCSECNEAASAAFFSAPEAKLTKGAAPIAAESAVV